MRRVSAIICTHNRADFLGKALESLTKQTMRSDDYEVIVVDNASTDQTASVVGAFRTTLPGLRYVREERLGLSWARNTGAQIATAPYVAYLDDDAHAEPEWLERIVQAFELSSPAPAAVGGRVWLDWARGVPAWLPRRYWSLYTYLDHGDEARYLLPNEHLVGANMAFRRDVLLASGGFDSRLGRRGTTLLSGEEAAVIQTLRDAQMPIYYEPQAAVWHAVPEARRRRRWLWMRLFWDGASQPLLDRAAHPRQFYVSQAYQDMRRSGFFVVQWLRALRRGERALRVDSALALIQRLGRLRTHCLLVWRVPQ
ncbi:MAG: glycosyltransferase family 2 protein [Kouleothrix sp.]|nr:glycosyltransferase family 2 protein [Kouleothrix sp.]